MIIAAVQYEWRQKTTLHISVFHSIFFLNSLPQHRWETQILRCSKITKLNLGFPDQHKRKLFPFIRFLKTISYVKGQANGTYIISVTNRSPTFTHPYHKLKIILPPVRKNALYFFYSKLFFYHLICREQHIQQCESLVIEVNSYSGRSLQAKKIPI